MGHCNAQIRVNLTKQPMTKSVFENTLYNFITMISRTQAITMSDIKLFTKKLSYNGFMMDFCW